LVITFHVRATHPSVGVYISEFTPKNRPKLPTKRKILFKNHLFSGALSSLVSGRGLHLSQFSGVSLHYSNMKDNQVSTNIKGELLVKFCSFLEN